MASSSVESALVARFNLVKAPTLEAGLPGAVPIVFSRMRSERAQRERSITPRPEDVFTFQAPLITAAFSGFRIAQDVYPKGN